MRQRTEPFKLGHYRRSGATSQFRGERNLVVSRPDALVRR